MAWCRPCVRGGQARGARRSAFHRSQLCYALAVSVAAFLGFAPVAALAEVRFDNPITLMVGGNPDSVAVADLNGDSRPDLAVANAKSDNVSVLLGGAGGSFGAATSFAAGRLPSSVAVSDFNGDSRPDLIVGDFGTSDVSVLLASAGGGFGPPTSFVGGTYADDVGYVTGVAVGDFNGDSDPDLTVANSGTRTVSVLLGGAGGSFSSHSNVRVGDRPQSVAVSDFNGDSLPDLAVANYNSHDVSILLGGAGANFGAATTVPVGSYPDTAFPTSVAVGDFNGDSDPDLAVANSGSDNVSILLGAVGGSFGTAKVSAVGRRPSAVAVGDFNSDAHPDLAVANAGADSVSVLVGRDGGTFDPAVNLAVGSRPQSVAVGDFNGDAHTDLVVANLGSDSVSLLLGSVPSSSGAQPESGLPSPPAQPESGIPSPPASAPGAPVGPTPASPSALISPHLRLDTLRRRHGVLELRGRVDRRIDRRRLRLTARLRLPHGHSVTRNLTVRVDRGTGRISGRLRLTRRLAKADRIIVTASVARHGRYVAATRSRTIGRGEVVRRPRR